MLGSASDDELTSRRIALLEKALLGNDGEKVLLGSGPTDGIRTAAAALAHEASILEPAGTSGGQGWLDSTSDEDDGSTARDGGGDSASTAGDGADGGDSASTADPPARRFPNWPQHMVERAKTDQYPPQPTFSTKHCPAMPTPPVCRCNCVDAHNYLSCICESGGILSEFLAQQLADAKLQSDDERMSNNLMRKAAYQEAWRRLNGQGQWHVRSPLPHCVVALVRMAWPEPSGVYMGFKQYVAPAQ
jgi:hypothetical protein